MAQTRIPKTQLDSTLADTSSAQAITNKTFNGTNTFPTFNQNTTGTASTVTGTVAITNGGTGQATQQAALNALSGTQSAGKYLRSDGTNTGLATITAGDVPTLNQSTTGSAASFTGSLAGDVSGTQSATSVNKINGTSMAGLATGIVKNTTSTGVPSIAVAADFPTLNQNTTGSAATLTTSRTIAGVAFNGSANIAIASTGLSDTASITYLTTAATLTNKNVASATNTFAAVTTAASSATPAPTGDSRENELYLTAQTAGMTFAAPSGTPVNGNKLFVRVKTAAAQTVAFNAIYVASGVAPLMTTTVAGKTHTMQFRYDSAAAAWIQLAVDATGY